MNEEELHREIVSGAFSMQVADYERNIRIQFEKLQQEKQQIEDNWNKLKEWLVQLQKFKGINQQGFSWGVAQEVLDKMQEIEGGMDETNY